MPQKKLGDGGRVGMGKKEDILKHDMTFEQYQSPT